MKVKRNRNNQELEYLQVIRNIRDNNPELFKKIKNLPKKARTSKKYQPIKNDILLSFFRKGMLKKFYLADNKTQEAKELNFF